MSLFSSTARTELIEVHRATTVRDGYGENAETFGLHYRAYASVRNGTGGERRQAAQEGGAQAATFGLTFSTVAAGTKLTDQIQYQGATWDITSAVVEPQNAGVVLTAIRAQ
ncbi:head-tail adaptor [Sphingomonas kaistensis]|uniref:Head-tail adaptor n=1 Tax=Sphingomonas kaistensis TaxID=298708 RepID=A0A7X6BH29_9SPHN|nr:head-tail adaptor protein [Sphingomonas kaistensis]NJC06518.1 head-tail adaptor [Sphingomonas kaistensis]